MSAGWVPTFDHMLDLYRWWDSRDGRMYAEGFATDIDNKGRWGGEPARLLPEYERVKLLRGEPIYVGEEIREIVLAARETFEPEAWRLEDLLTPHGFLLLPAPLHITDVHGKQLGWRAACWCPTTLEDEDGRRRPGLHLSLYSHMDDEDGYPEPTDDPDVRRLMAGSGGLSLAHFTPIPLDDLDYVESADRDPTRGFHELSRDFQVLMKLAQQTLAERRSLRPPRPQRRRAARLGLPELPVTVIQLRKSRTRTEEGESREVDWQYRWIVRGFWRWQWYPSEKRHKQIWISDFVKGPPDKPLRVTKRAFEFTR